MRNLTDDALPAGTTLDNLVIERVLGQGGFGITYAVWDEALHKRFCLKEFFPQGLAMRQGLSVRASTGGASTTDFKWARDRFFTEARTLAQLKHPNIVDVIRVFEANNTVYMLLRYVEGKTFEHWLKARTEDLTQRDLAPIVDGLLSALEAVHSNSTLHLDISPDNIMIEEGTNAPVLLDFGAARVEIKRHSQLLSALIFKHGYSAPEQYTSSAGQYGPWTDIYALGATLYRAVTGRRPDDAPSRQLGERQSSAFAAAAGRFDSRFLAGIDKAMRLKPDERPRSVAGLRALLAPVPTAVGWGISMPDMAAMKAFVQTWWAEALAYLRGLPGVQRGAAAALLLLLAIGLVLPTSVAVETEAAPEQASLVHTLPFTEMAAATRTIAVPVTLEPWKRNRTRGSIGLTLFTLEKPYFEALGISMETAVQVAQVADGSSAQAAGLKMGDIILGWNGQPIRNITGFFDQVVASKPEEVVSLEVLRIDAPGTYFEEIVRRAELGKPHLMFHVGMIFRTGAQIQRNDEEAFRWFEKAARGGDVQGMWALAVAYFKGEGTKADGSQGLYWLMRAADTGDVGMQFALGSMLLDGPIQHDEGRALDLLQRAASAGNSKAMLRLGQYFHARRNNQALGWYERAADAGESDAMLNLGVIHSNGQLGTARNQETALEWYGKAMRLHHRTAFYNAAMIYEDARDGLRDATRAAALMMRALEMGEPLAIRQMTGNWRRWKKDTRAELQRLMAQAGVYEGRTDGEFSQDTLAALRNFSG